MTDFSEMAGQAVILVMAHGRSDRSEGPAFGGWAADAHDDDGAPIQLAWKEGEVRLATSPTRSGPHSTRPARCAARLASTYETRGVHRHHQHLQLALFEHASLPLLLLSSMPCPGTHKATGHKGVLER